MRPIHSSIAFVLAGVALPVTIGGCQSGRSNGTGDHDLSVLGIEIVAAADAGLQGAPGDAIQLQALFDLSDGTKAIVPYSNVDWKAPATVMAEDPNDAGPSSVLPEAGAEPTAFFVSNAYRITHEGVLYITDPGTVAHPVVTVTASVEDAGSASVKVKILPAPVGNPSRGRTLYESLPDNPCAGCHGSTARGSPPVDGGDYRLPSGSGGELFQYPAPPLNDVTTDAGPNLAADPTWSAGLLGVAAQADIDNQGVALRAAMPTFFAAKDDARKTLGAQDYADIYAWLKTETR